MPQQEVCNELIRVRQATERVQRDTQHLKDIAGVKGAIEAVGEAWLPLFQQFMANQAEANRCTQETYRLLRRCVTIMEADQERRRTERQRADAPSPPGAGHQMYFWGQKCFLKGGGGSVENRSFHCQLSNVRRQTYHKHVPFSLSFRLLSRPVWGDNIPFCS